MAIPNPYNRYRQTQVQTSSPEQLILMLYDGAIRFSLQARDYIAVNNLAAAHQALVRVQDIIAELMISLDHGAGEIADQLQQLYDYLYRRAMEANTRKDATIVDEVIRFLRELRSTWSEAMLLARQHVRAGVGNDDNS